MRDMERRSFVKGAAMGALAFSINGTEVFLTAQQARAQAVPFRLLNAREGEMLEALGDTLVPGARRAGIAHFIDHQVAVPRGEALLTARLVNIPPPYVNFYRAAIRATDGASQAMFDGRRFTQISAGEQYEFVDLMRQGKVTNWQGPPAPFVYFVLRSDAVDVVYGTVEGFESLGIPYMAHISPDKRW